MKTKNVSSLLLCLALVCLIACEPFEQDTLTPDVNNFESSAIDEFIPQGQCTNCTLQNAENISNGFPWGILLYHTEHHTDDGPTRTPYLLDDGSGQIILCDDGTAYLEGSIHGQFKNSGELNFWDFQVHLSDGLSYDDWSAMGGGFTTGGLDVGDLFMDWTFYIVDPDQTSRLIGTGNNTGIEYLIKHKPVDFSKRIQVGYGANNRNFNLGLIGWFSYTELDGSNPRQGDFIFDLECPPPNPEGNCCDGKVSALTLQYNGEETAEVVVTQKKDNIVVFEAEVDPGEQFSFVGADKNGTLSTEIIVSVDGEEHTRIHTSCSTPIGPGLVSGDFEVIEGESRNGGTLIFCDVVNEDDGCCDGKVTALTLQYDGDDSGHVVVTQKKDNIVVYDAEVEPGEQFSFVGADKNGTLGTDIIISVDGEEHTRIHTSCSLPIGPGLVSGDFVVIEGESRNSILCEITDDNITGPN